MGTENKNVRFALVKITTDQFAIFDGTFNSGEDLNLKVGFQFGGNKDMHLISVKTQITFEQSNIPFILIEASCFFNINADDWEVFEQETDIIVPQHIMTHFCVLAVGTIRGILHAKTEGTNYNGFIIPTINITELVTSDIKI